MKILKTEFRKNSLDYTLLERTDKVALFQLGHLPDPDGYEVCRIYPMKTHKAFGVVFEESEVISSDSQFMSDGSGSFMELGNALRHFENLTASLIRQQYVDEISPSDSEIIAEWVEIMSNMAVRTDGRKGIYEGGSYQVSSFCFKIVNALFQCIAGV